MFVGKEHRTMDGILEIAGRLSVVQEMFWALTFVLLHDIIMRKIGLSATGSEGPQGFSADQFVKGVDLDAELAPHLRTRPEKAFFCPRPVVAADTC